MANKGLKIENLENLQEITTEEFSSIQGGLLAMPGEPEKEDNSELTSLLERSDCRRNPLPAPDPQPSPCKTYVFNYNGEEIHFVWCPVIL